MLPDVDECTIQSVLGWWQGREDYLLKSVVGTTNGYNYTYLDHAIYCSKYEVLSNIYSFLFCPLSLV